MPREGQLQPAMAWSGFAHLCEQMGIHLAWGRKLVDMTGKNGWSKFNSGRGC